MVHGRLQEGGADHTSVKGMFIYRPYGYALWENIQASWTGASRPGHENVYLPVLIPESLLQEKDHVEGLHPNVRGSLWAAVKLEDRCAIRPTSETLFCEHYANIIHSWRDPPKLYNQAVQRAAVGKDLPPFLRHREFLWQEGPHHARHRRRRPGKRPCRC